MLYAVSCIDDGSARGAADVAGVPLIGVDVAGGRLAFAPATSLAAQAKGAANPEDAVFPETGLREIRLLGQRLNEMRLRIRGMLEQRTAMLRAVSHGRRMPLTRLKLRVE